MGLRKGEKKQYNLDLTPYQTLVEDMLIAIMSGDVSIPVELSRRATVIREKRAEAKKAGLSEDLPS